MPSNKNDSVDCQNSSSHSFVGALAGAWKSYGRGSSEISVLQNLSMVVPKNKMCVPLFCFAASDCIWVWQCDSGGAFSPTMIDPMCWILSGWDLYNMAGATPYFHFRYGLLGPSGCGKTTLLRCILGRLKLDHGHVMTLGKTPGSRGHQVPGRSVGYMPQVMPSAMSIWSTLLKWEATQNTNNPIVWQDPLCDSIWSFSGVGSSTRFSFCDG